MTGTLRSLLALGLLAALVCPDAGAQFATRSRPVGNDGIKAPVDASGRSPKDLRVRAVHTTDPALPGGTAYLIRKDPYLAYQIGRNLNFLEFRSRDGVLARKSKLNGASGLGGPLGDGTTSQLTIRNHVSCLGCHNIPNGNPGGGITIAKDGGRGRQAPHYYGAGLVEMIGLQTRAVLLDQIDTDGDGWVDAIEAASAPASLTVTPAPGAPALDFGDPRLSGGLTGTPSFDNVVTVWYVDLDGVHVPGATGVDGVTTFGYDFHLEVWGWGQGPGNAGLNPTNRAFLWDPFVTHSGLEAHDPTTNVDADGDGISGPTLAGALQFPATHRAPDPGLDLHPNGYSRDDPDNDDYLTEISEGDLDLAEWFLLNVPAPAVASTQADYDAGVALMDQFGCTSCHVTDWMLEAQGGIYDGDRRFFDFDVVWNDANQRLEGFVRSLATTVGDEEVPDRDSFLVRGVFSDFRHHEMGPDFAEFGFDGSSHLLFRTAPLWGVGSGFPWGHDGASLTLRDVILRHGGDALASRVAFETGTAPDQEALIGFLESLVLYDIESLPADVDRDFMIETDFIVQGKNTGLERFNAEWLFDIPVEIQGDVPNALGQTIRSFAGINLRDAYGTQLEYRKDSDGDAWPDVWDVNDDVFGPKNGVN